MTDHPTPAPPVQPGHPPPDLERPREHLKLLSIFYYIYAGLMALSGCLSMMYLVIGGVMLGSGEDPARVAGGFFLIFGGCFLVFSLVLAYLVYRAGRCLTDHRSRTFIMVIAGIICINAPLGTVLGVFTLVVLTSDGAKALFEQAAATGVPHWQTALPDQAPSNT